MVAEVGVDVGIAEPVRIDDINTVFLAADVDLGLNSTSFPEESRLEEDISDEQILCGRYCLWLTRHPPTHLC